MTQDTGPASPSNGGNAPAAVPPSETMNDFFGVIPTSDTPSEQPAPASASAVADTSTTAQPDQPAAPAVPPPPPPSKFAFAGMEFDDQAKAEHAFKTFRGSHRALEIARQNERIAQLQNQQLQQRLEALETQLRGSSQPPATEGAPKGDADQAGQKSEVDWELFRTLQEKFGPDYAQKWLHATNTRIVNEQVAKVAEQLEQRITERFAPLQETHAYNEKLVKVAELVRDLSTYHFEGGRPAYPELSDTVAAAEIRSIWDSMDLPEDSLLSKQGLALAISHYRDRRAQAALAAGQSRPSNQPTTSVPAPAPPPAAASASAVSSPTDAAPMRPNSLSAEEQRKADIRNAPVAVAADW